MSNQLSSIFCCSLNKRLCLFLNVIGLLVTETLFFQMLLRKPLTFTFLFEFLELMFDNPESAIF